MGIGHIAHIVVALSSGVALCICATELALLAGVTPRFVFLKVQSPAEPPTAETTHELRRYRAILVGLGFVALCGFIAGISVFVFPA
ncbi:MAG: hypothetical protein RBT63_11225 [Bdellovibrionales bacterium]|jgi:hypothetical protein|nr:hypothetical protein [Bdellovibrionales bacterium]